jgi:cytochrome c oxidase subunit 2
VAEGVIYVTFARLFRRRPTWLAFVVLGLVLAACAGDYPQNAMSPKSDFARSIDSLFWTIIYWSIGVFLVVEVLLVYALIRFRRRPGQPPPAQVHGNARLEIAWTLAPALVLASIAIPTVRTIYETQGSVTPDALQVRVVGHQWWWEFQYPQLGVVTASDLHLPVGRKVDFSLETVDLIHSFWVPNLGGKRDVIPLHVNRISLTASEPGVYWGQCAEFCGVSHANMAFRTIVEEPEKFEAWVQAMKTPPAAPAPADPLVAKGAQLFATSACVACHKIAGTSAQGVTGPNLTRFGSRLTIAAGMMDNTPENLARWLRNSPDVKPGSLMPNLNLNDETVSALVAYLESLK